MLVDQHNFCCASYKLSMLLIIEKRNKVCVPLGFERAKTENSLLRRTTKNTKTIENNGHEGHSKRDRPGHPVARFVVFWLTAPGESLCLLFELEELEHLGRKHSIMSSNFM